MQNHQNITSALIHALEMSPPARKEYLARLHQEDHDLWIELQSLLGQCGDSDRSKDESIDSQSIEQLLAELKGEVTGAWDANEESHADSTKREPAPGTIERYSVERVLGRGGFGVVYLAHDEKLDRQVAIKVPHASLVPGRDEAEAYLKEARTVARLDHPNIVPVYHVGETAEYPCFIVTKYIDGNSLLERLTQGHLSYVESARLTATLADALHYAHQQRVVHRDIKPGNIVLDSAGRPYIVDFGLALREADIGKGPRFVGTAAYMSPEQARNESHLVDARTDVYSLGVVFYLLLTGQRPFADQKDRKTLLEWIANREPPPPRQCHDSVPRELDRICLRAIAKRAIDRYSTALDFAEDLRMWLAENPDYLVHPKADSARIASPASARSQPAIASDIPAESIIPKGLRAYDAHDAGFFLDLLPGPHDRAGLPLCIRFWKNLIEETDEQQTFRVGVVYGPSGCGKSSIVKAGLIPRVGSRIKVAYVESSGRDTEASLLKSIRKLLPDLPATLTLSQALTVIRRGQFGSANAKLVVVFDQFEQWLHVNPVKAECELIRALRQCHGSRLQALLLVRDDFWMGISRLMQHLEIPIREGQNAAAVDLFDTRHARKVLTAFGRAYEALPSGELRPEERRFLELAVAGLAQDEKVIPVRLALFAEMVKGKPWTPQTWNRIGGAEGIGTAFLEETFAAKNAPPQYRVHDQAARQILQQLLPEPGGDLKGPKKTYRELLLASGYRQRQDDFDNLMRILDSELRLITSTDSETAEQESHSNPDLIACRCFQLTHDFLVPAVRDWLQQKLKETRRGRAQLRLAERASLWSVKRENRHLPSVWEWASIRLLTARRRWAASQKAMMRNADWFYALRGAMVAAVLVAALLITREVWSQIQMRGMLQRLDSAKIEEVPAILDHMRPYRFRLIPHLQSGCQNAASEKDLRKRVLYSLALLQSDSSHVDFLYNRMLQAPPAEFSVLRAELAPYKSTLVKSLQTVLSAHNEDLDRRFRAACALAAFAPDAPALPDHAQMLAARLVDANPLFLDGWTEALRPIREQIRLPLVKLIESEISGFPKRRTSAELFFALSAGDRTWPGELENRMLELKRVLPEAQGRKKAELAKSIVNLATALVRMGHRNKVLPMLGKTADPTIRCYLIDRLARSGAEPQTLQNLIDPKFDPSVRRAAILAMGELKADRMPSLRPRLLQFYKDDPDPGIHSAVEWLVRHWAANGHDSELDRILKSLAGGKPKGNRRWFINRKLQTYVMVRRGAMTLERRAKKRQLHVERDFAIAAKQVTVADFLQWNPKHKYDPTTAPHELCPINNVTAMDAAGYCNWLSERDGISSDQFCYIKKANGEFRLAPNYLERGGYRLPTQSEWELAARAGVKTGRLYGEASSEISRKYAQFYDSIGVPRKRRLPVGALFPNDLGLFDVHGSTSDLCESNLETNSNDSYRRFSLGSFHPTSGMSPSLSGKNISFRPARTLHNLP